MSNTIIETPIGRLWATANERGLRSISMTEPAGFHGERSDGGHPVLCQLRTQLAEYFAGTRRTFELTLDALGTEFQRQAWRALQAIPFGATRSYREQAEAIGRPTAVRAIGAANGRNPLPIVVPCHRVIGADGSLTGFAGGLTVKRALLAHEARIVAGAASDLATEPARPLTSIA